MTENHRAKKCYQLGPKCIRFILYMVPFHAFFKNKVKLLHVRIKTTGKLLQFNVLIFEFFYPYVHKAIGIMCCKVVNVLVRSTVQSLDQSMVFYKVRLSFSGFYPLWC